jgi:tetratricopeptide (TPR) repeat protein
VADTRGDYTAGLVLGDYRFARGRDYLEQGETEKGLESFAQCLAIVGENRETLNNLGSASAEHGQLDAAAEYYARALENEPDYVLAMRNLGKLYMQTEKYARALVQFQKLVKKLPRDYEGHWLIAQCLQTLGRVDDALGELQLLSEIAPESHEVYREMGMIYLNEKGDMTMARRMFAKSLSINRDQPELLMLMSQQEAQPPGYRPPMPGPSPMPGVTPPVPQIPMPQMPKLPGR